MIYRQNSSFLRYDEYPFSSNIYEYEPDDPQCKEFLAVNGYYRFCRPHNHTAVEIVFVLHGRIRALLNGESFVAETGDLVICNPFDIHTITVYDVAEKTRIQVINFDLELLSSHGVGKYSHVLKNLVAGEWRFSSHIRGGDAAGKALAAHTARLHTLYSDRAGETALLRIVAALYEWIAEARERGVLLQGGKDGAKDTKGEFAKRVVQYVRENYARPISTQDVALALHLDKSYFCRLFHAVFAEGFVTYLHEHRIAVAKNLRLDEKTGLAEIAAAVGYTNYDAFTTYFKRYTGMKPKDYYRARDLSTSL